MREEKKEIIKNYLLNEKISEEERKERFEIAWDIWEHFDNIKLNLKQQMLKNFINKIKNSDEFKNYEINDEGLIEGKRFKPLIIFKRDWALSPDNQIGILNYAFEAEQNSIHENCIGIVKQDNDKQGIPFKGNWQQFEKNSNELFIKCSEIYNILGGSSYGWKVSEGWIVWKFLDSFYRGMWQREFYLQIITNDGIKKAVNYLFSELITLKSKTEKYIDEIVRIYLKN